MMMKLFRVISILCMYPLLTHQYPDKSSYVGGVVEYRPIDDPAYGEKLPDLNAENYVKFIKKAHEHATDILVFPESSLSMSTKTNVWATRTEGASYVPDPDAGIAPCDYSGKYASSLVNISCAARTYKMYVVINHKEKVDCEQNCSADRLLIYNTNVAFDRNGVVVGRYRKFNLFEEIGVNVTSEPIPSYFKTDFGVTFGQIICFDVLFQSPALDLVRNHSITDLVFSSHWFSKLPYLSAAGVQAGWAYANNVNLLASGYHNSSSASGGSGIYLGKDGPVHVISGTKFSHVLLVAEIPKVINGNRIKKQVEWKVHEFQTSKMGLTDKVEAEENVFKKDKLAYYVTELINPEQGVINKTLCHEDFCCNFKLRYDFDKEFFKKKMNYYRYRLSAFSGIRSRNIGGIRTCGIVACPDEDVTSCGNLSSANVTRPLTFQSIDISTTIKKDPNVFFTPLTTTINNLLPLNPSEFDYQTYDLEDSQMYRMTLEKPKDDLYSFTIFGRNFAQRLAK